MAQNDYQTFGDSGTDGVNKLSLTNYTSDNDRIYGNGYTTKLLRSQLVNKALQQTSKITSAVAQFLVNNGISALDTDSSAVIATNLGNIIAMGAGIGSNQTWQDVASNRALGTTYTNSTGKPILVVVMCGGTQSADLTLGINGSVFIRQCVYNGASQAGTVYGIIPNGSTYIASLTSGSAIGIKWNELR